MRTLSTYDVPPFAAEREIGTRKPYRKRVAIKRHEFLRKPIAAVASRPAAPSLEVSRCAVSRTAVETSASSSSARDFVSGSARMTAPERADTPRRWSVSLLTLIPPYTCLLEAV